MKACIPLLFLLSAGQPIASLPSAGLLEIGWSHECLVAVISAPRSLEPGARLLLVDGVRPVGWLDLAETREDRATFRSSEPLSQPSSGRTRAWLVAPDAVARFSGDWPMGAGLFATIDRVGPGFAHAWVTAGTEHGVEPGDQWLQLFAGQPVARFDVRSTDSGLSFCAVVPLADGWLPTPGQRVGLWPTPGQRRRGQASTAVAFVESAGEDDAVVWVAAPRHVECPREAHLDFWRDGRWLGYGVVEARDELFWYARLVAVRAASELEGPTSQPAPAASAESAAQPASRPAASEASWEVEVGDVATIRTSADIQAKRFVSHVFDSEDGGWLIDAGEVDGLKLGDQGAVLRQGERVGTIELLRVQRGYSVARAVAEGAAPALGDEVWFGPPPAPDIAVARIAEVVGKALLVAQVLPGQEPPLLAPMAIRSGRQVVGVAVLLARDEQQLMGLAFEESLARSPRPGDLLTLEGGRSDDATRH